ncbi:helix-turn-helix domain-containing protein [Tenacibaculum aquimarinum]|uniref:helix-turn-helix domain-containing protein n=1 Tax=Tenacibaculum aquimarinum TaxID=2910675 RepID=UPI001F0AEDA5|nr:helix-turn-helix transcriptional regulator [Tenacibaculum aquimarinum]MCH3881584.1 helix-turn-helix domain-containing protein [Tenacibaculum aquimarinum]
MFLFKTTEELESNLLKRIKEEREKMGLSQYELAKRIGLGQSAYQKIEKGKTRLDMFRFLKITQALGVYPKDFFDN